MRDKYRIVTDEYSGFEVQVKRWWWPFWLQLNGVNTSPTLKRAYEHVEEDRRGKIKPLIVWSDE